MSLLSPFPTAAPGSVGDRPDDPEPLTAAEWAATLATCENGRGHAGAPRPVAARLRDRVTLLLARLGLRPTTYLALDLADVAAGREGTTLAGVRLPSADAVQLCPGCALLEWADLVQAHQVDGDAGVWVVSRRPRSYDRHRCQTPWAVPAGFPTVPLFRTVSRAGHLGGARVSRDRLRTVVLSAVRRAGVVRPVGLSALTSSHLEFPQVSLLRGVKKTGIVTVTERFSGRGTSTTRPGDPSAGADPAVHEASSTRRPTRADHGAGTHQTGDHDATHHPTGHRPGHPGTAHGAAGHHGGTHHGGGHDRHPAADGSPWLGHDTRRDGRTVAAYLADWRLFRAWCRAHDRPFLPATAETVDEFLADHPAPPGTQHRRRTAIRQIHRAQGHPAPARPRPRPAVPLRHRPDDLTTLLRTVPRSGWTTGLFGRRDALLLLLRQRAGLTVPELCRLTTEHLSRDGGELRISTGSRTVVLDRTEHTADCPGCCWVRWRVLLRHAHLHSPAPVLAGLVSRPVTEKHVCDRPEHPELTEPLPVFPPLTRWGAFPLPLHPAGVRALTEVSSRYALGDPPVRPIVPLRHAIRPQPAPVVAAPPPVPDVHPDRSPEVAARGMAARRSAVAALADTGRQLDLMEDTLAELRERIDRLMTELEL